MKIRQDIMDLVKEYTKLNGWKFLENESSNNTLFFMTNKGTKAKTTPASISQYIEFKTGKKPFKNLKDLFGFQSQKQVKKEWKPISCSMTIEEIKEIEKIMALEGIKSHNQLLRQVLLKLIEAYK